MVGNPFEINHLHEIQKTILYALTGISLKKGFNILQHTPALPLFKKSI